MTSPAVRRNALALTAVAGAGALVAGLVSTQGASADAQPNTFVAATSSPSSMSDAIVGSTITRSAARAALGTPSATATPSKPAAKATSAAATAKTAPAKPVAKPTPAKAATRPAAKAAAAKLAPRAAATTAAAPRGPRPASAFGTPTSDLSASQMRLVQAELTVAGFEVPRTGHFGEMTQDALRAFQKANGLDQTGGPGPRTLAKLSAHGTKARALLARESGEQASATSTVRAASNGDTSTTTKPAARTTRQASTRSSAASSAAQRAVAFAYDAIGTPYVYGGTGNGGYDCSGLTGAAWASAGVSIPRTSQAQMGLSRVSLDSLRPGDLVIYYGGSHVAIYVGDGMVIHAPRPGKGVEKVSMDSMPVTMAVRPA